MRFIDDPYAQELRAYALASRMLRHEARASTIVAWTGVSRERIRRLAVKLATADSRGPPIRHRGRSPTQSGYFLHSAGRTVQATVLAFLCEDHRAVPKPGSATLRGGFAGLERGERLCEAYETYCRMWSPRERLVSFEYTVLLVRALACTRELALGRCVGCDGLWLIDPYGDPHSKCVYCRLSSRLVVLPPWHLMPLIGRDPRRIPHQLSLFEGPDTIAADPEKAAQDPTRPHTAVLPTVPPPPTHASPPPALRAAPPQAHARHSSPDAPEPRPPRRGEFPLPRPPDPPPKDD